ncbi:methyltransferase domain-containing protein [Caloramator sp. ALD01]|uniref:methyltransferase domain-containing protein n=1 Tax=Caloramator sp. ALD01 TaxID=1031288 RepID=UPI00040232F4|nr:methyltransferase domain-containing protein [Caloramator sp. ALD01]
MYINQGKMQFENDEIKELFGIKDGEKDFPIYLQNIIVDLIYKEIGLVRTNNDIFSSLSRIDKNVVLDVIQNIESMYSLIQKTDYSNKYLTYLWYYLPNNIYKVWAPLIDLATLGELKTNIKILDIGTGPGSLPIGVIELYKVLAEKFGEQKFNIEFFLVDSQKKFLEYANSILNKLKDFLPKNLNIKVYLKLCEVNSKEILVENLKFDIISMSNFINHFEHNDDFDAFEFLSKLKNNLLYDGSIIIIEPGSKEECRDMKLLRNRLVNEGVYNLFSPCLSIWEERQNINCSCFTSYSMPIKKPELISFLNEMGLNKNKYKEYVAFNYLVLRTDGLMKYSVCKNKQSYYTIKEVVEGNFEVGKRYNIKGIVKTKSFKNNSFCICDGSVTDRNFWIKIENDAVDEVKELFNRINMGELVNVKKVQFKDNNFILDKKSKLDVFF